MNILSEALVTPRQEANDRGGHENYCLRGWPKDWAVSGPCDLYS